MPAEPSAASIIGGPKPAALKSITIRDYISQEAEKLGIPGSLALAITNTESAGRSNAVSPKGAQGFFQLMPETAADMGVDPSDPFQNIQGGLKYFKQQLDGHGGDVRLALAAYNAGPGRTAGGKVPEIPETQDYVMRVLTRWQQDAAGQATGQATPGATTTSAAPPTPAGPPPTLPPGATAGMVPASTVTGGDPRQATGLSKPSQFIADAATAVKAKAAQAVFGGGDLIRRGVNAVMGDQTPTMSELVSGERRPYMERVINRPAVQEGMKVPDTLGGKVGAFATEAAEFAYPASKITAARKALGVTTSLIKAGISPGRARLVSAAIEGGAQAAAASGISLVHGDDPKAAAVISAATPIAGQMITSMAPAIRRAAVTKLAKFMERGVKGDITPEVERNLVSAANDFIDLPLQRTWRQMKRMTAGLRKGAGENLEAGLAGPIGDIPVVKGPIIKELDDMAQEAFHYVQQQGGLTVANFDPATPRAVNELKSLLDQYNDTIPARQLHDIKEVWWKAVYPEESTQPVSSTAELLNTAQKEARFRGGKSIMQVLENDAPSVSALDDAVSHAAKLDQFVRGLERKARKGTLTGATARHVAGGIGGAVGAAAGGAVGHPFIGFGVGNTAGKLVIKAVTSPKWRLQPIWMRRRLADALAAGNVDAVRKLVTPIVLAATADQDNLLSESNRASASR